MALHLRRIDNLLGLALVTKEIVFASEMKRHTYRQLLTLPHRSLCSSYAELVRAGIEMVTMWFLAERSTD